jgi:hypothetical protein
MRLAKVRWLLIASAVLLATIIAYVAKHQSYSPTFSVVDGETLNIDVLKQLKFIESAIDSGAAEQMQQYYPEGYVFTLSLYGLAHVELLETLRPNGKQFNKSKQEVEEVLALLKSNKGKSVFQKDLPLPYGAYYNGWLNYLRAEFLCALPDSLRSRTMLNELNYFSDQLAQTFKNSPSQYIESYAGMVWPADVMSCLAAYKLNLKLNHIENDTLINWWLKETKAKLDERSLIPHSAHIENGSPLESSMGSSQSLMLCFMHTIDSTSGAEMFKAYKEHFLIHRFGLPAVSERAKGEKGGGHIDSGPVVWKVGAAASIVGVKAFSLYGEKQTAKKIRNSINAFAFAKTNEIEKHYMFGKWIMVDAFMAWINASETTPKNTF